MTEKPIRCELVTWGQVYRLARRLAGMIRNAGFQPDVIVAVARGGYVPARLLCDFLGVYNLASIRIAHYEAGAHMSPQARLSSPLSLDVHGLKVLLVDDVNDTGDTLTLAIEHIRSFKPAQLKVAVLQHKQVSPVNPDFYAQKILAWRWLIYPWAVIEDIGGFLADMSPPPASPEEALERLNTEYGIKVSRRTIEDVWAGFR
jgi:hypoxanthine phosphoribosyltransferase